MMSVAVLTNLIDVSSTQLGDDKRTLDQRENEKLKFSSSTYTFILRVHSSFDLLLCCHE